MKMGAGVTTASNVRKNKGENMEDYTLVQQFLLIGLDGTDSRHKSVAKSAVLRAAAAGKRAERLLASGDCQSPGFADKLEKEMKTVKSLKTEVLNKEAGEDIGILISRGALDEVPDLLGCDMYYDTAGVDLMVYRSDQDIYQKVTEALRAELLEEGELTDDGILLLWMIRESGFIHEIFSAKEQEEISQKMVRMAASGQWTGVLWKQEFHKAFESLGTAFLRKKKKLFQNPYMQGVNLTFPFLERRQAVFVDFVIFGTTVNDEFFMRTRAFCGRSKEWNRNSFKNRQHILPHCPQNCFMPGNSCSGSAAFSCIPVKGGI